MTMKKLILKEEPIFRKHQISYEEKIYNVLVKSKIPLSYSLICIKAGVSNGGAPTSALRGLVARKLVKQEICESCGFCKVYSLLKS